MTVTNDFSPLLDVGGVLLSGADEGRERQAIEHALKFKGWCPPNIAVEMVRRAIRDVLGVRIADVLCDTWLDYRELLAAARESLTAGRIERTLPEKPVPLELPFEIQVDLELGVLERKTFDGELDITVTMTGVTAVVESGYLISWSPGPARWSATLSLESITIATTPPRGVMMFGPLPAPPLPLRLV